MEAFQNPGVEARYQAYPDTARAKLLALRQLIFETAAQQPDIGHLEETLKWNEPSYIAKMGSTIRLGWKSASPDHYAMYFNCNTKLVDTFREIYANDFRFEGNRAIVFSMHGEIPTGQLRHCIVLALRYHTVKHLPLLGA